MIKACSKVDLPEPVLPAVRTCCEVPLPSFKCCSLVAPARPSGMSTPLLVSKLQYSSSLGAMNENGTSTRLASRAATPTLCSSSENRPGIGGRIEGQGIPAEIGLPPVQPALLPDHVDARGLELLELEARRQAELRIVHHQGIDAAPRAAVDDADQAAQRGVVEIGREVGDDQDPERLGDLAGHRVVLFDRLELVAQVLLDHVLHVLGEIGQLLLDVLRLGPDAVGDQKLVVIAQMHERGEILAQADRVDDGVADLARRHGGQVAQHERLEQLDRLVLAGVGRLDQERALNGKRQEGRQLEVGRHRFEPGIAGRATREMIEVDARRRRNACREEPRSAASSRRAPAGSNPGIGARPRRALRRRPR